jgi:ATP-dependent DNA helicase UvrD/PcrA
LTVRNNGQQPFEPTPQQLEAIEHEFGPMLVVAGAGTGKTSVLAQRIARLINTRVAKPNEILAVTYTRNAAAELVGRVAGLLYPGVSSCEAADKLIASGLQANTFHAYCFGLLRDAGLDFELIDEQDQYVYLRQRIACLKLQYFVESADLGRFLEDLLDFYKRCQDELRTPEDYAGYVARVERGEIPLPRVVKSKAAGGLSDEEVLGRCREIARVFRQVEDMLQHDGLGAFGHIIGRTVELLGRRHSMRQRAQKRARFILIDEFQDSNVAQIRLASLLAGDQANVFAVGDPDQAIYRFRGASSEAFDHFLTTFGAERVKRVTMSSNRRSTRHILRCAYQAIRCNPEVGSTKLKGGGWRREPLTCAREERDPQLAASSPVQAVAYNSREQEAEFIAATVEAIRRRQPGIKLSDVAVLYSQHNHRDLLLRELKRRDIPVQVKGADLFDTPEARDALAVLRILDSPELVALVRVAALPKFEVDAVRFRAELALAGQNVSAESALEKVPGGFAVMEIIREARHDLANANGALTAAIEIVHRSFELADSAPLRCLQALAEMWAHKPKPISGEQTLREFLEYVGLFRDARGVLAEDAEDAVSALAPKDLGAAPKNAVQLMTIHSAKGLEFPCVFVMRVASGSLPSNYHEPLVDFPRELRAYDSALEDVPKVLHEHEQRRMFYVAMTRAMDELYLCGKVGSEKRQPAPPAKYLRELVNLRTTAGLRDALDYRLLPGTIGPIQAAAEAVALPRVLQWLQLDPRPEMPTERLSPSAIEQYERCPFAFKLKRDWMIPEEAHARLQYGQSMHLALKAYFDGVQAGRPPGTEAVVACFLDEFAKAKIAEEEQRRRYAQDGRDQLVRFMASLAARPAGEVLENELRFSITIAGTTVNGRIDRIDRVAGEQVRVIDYKTGIPKSQEDADESLQLSVYALAAKQKGLDPVALVFINLKDGTAIETTRGQKDFAETECKVREVVANLAAGEFGPRTGPHCKGCSYHSICPAQELLMFTQPSVTAAQVH